MLNESYNGSINSQIVLNKKTSPDVTISVSGLCFSTCLLSVRHTPKDNESPERVINIQLVNRRYVKDSTCLSFLRKQHQGNAGPLVERGGNNLTTLCRIVFSFKGVGGERAKQSWVSVPLSSAQRATLDCNLRVVEASFCSGWHEGSHHRWRTTTRLTTGELPALVHTFLKGHWPLKRLQSSWTSFCQWQDFQEPDESFCEVRRW